MNKTEIFYLDAFTNQPFKGNPIAVCPVNKNFSYEKMQSIAFELNLSETAFIYPLDESDSFQESKRFSLKWFTPTNEVKLCGHGTLGTSVLLFDYFNNSNPEIYFETLSGIHSAKKMDNWVWLNFPKFEGEIYQVPEVILNTLGLNNYEEAIFSKQAENLLINIGEDIDIKNISPDFYQLQKIDIPFLGGLTLTQKGNNQYDFFSRYFTPWHGINEDPVTGSAHSLLGPYWNKKLNKDNMLAFQASKRGGEIKITLSAEQPDRVFLGGQAVQLIKGELLV